MLSLCLIIFFSLIMIIRTHNIDNLFMEIISRMKPAEPQEVVHRPQLRPGYQEFIIMEWWKYPYFPNKPRLRSPNNLIYFMIPSTDIKIATVDKSALDVMLESWPSDVRSKFMGLKYATSSEFISFTFEIHDSNSELTQYIGAGRKLGNTIELGYAIAQVKASLIPRATSSLRTDCTPTEHYFHYGYCECYGSNELYYKCKKWEYTLQEILMIKDQMQYFALMKLANYFNGSSALMFTENL